MGFKTVLLTVNSLLLLKVLKMLVYSLWLVYLRNHPESLGRYTDLYLTTYIATDMKIERNSFLLNWVCVWTLSPFAFQAYHCIVQIILWTKIRICVLSHFSPVQLFATLWIVAHQAPVSTGFSRQEYWGGLPCPPPGDPPDPRMEPVAPALQVNSLLLSHWRNSKDKDMGDMKDTSARMQDACFGMSQNPTDLIPKFCEKTKTWQ